MDTPTIITATSLIIGAVGFIGLYIKSRILQSDSDREERLKHFEEREQGQLDELRSRVETLSTSLDALRSHVMLLEGFRTAVLMLANSGGVCISPEVIIRLSQDVDAKIKEMNA